MAKLLLLGKGLNRDGWRPVCELLARGGHAWEQYDHPPEDPPQTGFDLGVLLGCDVLIPPDMLAAPRLGFALFHSSDLPKGRGWAPIYYTVRGEASLCQSLLFAAPEVDAGNLIAKARYPLAGDELEPEVREYDDRLTLALLEAALEPVLAGGVKGREQDQEGPASYWPRRRPADSEVNPDRTLRDLADHLRALPRTAPAFFNYRGRRFQLRLEPVQGEMKSFNPDLVEITRYF